jgi:energy-coupling factor transporter ATP-binding protein EcfA2
LTEIAVAIEVGAALWRASEDLKLTEKIKDALRKKEVLIVLGASGSGKTNLIISLNSAAGLVDPVWRMNRTTATARQQVRIKGQPFRVIDTPGQSLHEADRLGTVRQVAAKPLVRIVNVVSYGYHEYDTNVSNAVGPDGQPRAEFLEMHRQEELQALKQWLPVLGDRNTTKWILTAVAKADLWWHQREQVVGHYMSGEYNAAIKESDSNLRHVVLPYCSVAHKFYNRAPVDGSFDDRDRMRTNIHFLQQLVALE